MKLNYCLSTEVQRLKPTSELTTFTLQSAGAESIQMACYPVSAERQ